MASPRIVGRVTVLKYGTTGAVEIGCGGVGGRDPPEVSLPSSQGPQETTGGTGSGTAIASMNDSSPGPLTTGGWSVARQGTDRTSGYPAAQTVSTAVARTGGGQTLDGWQVVGLEDMIGSASISGKYLLAISV